MTDGASLRTVLLALPAAAYGAAVRLRNAWYDRPRAAQRMAIPVISVGNLAVGGTGKTPLVAWLARRAMAEGLVPAVVSRGYGGRAGKGPIVVSVGAGPRVEARICGDEPHLLARTLAGAVVVVGSDRASGVEAAAETGATVALLDDGFQHRRIARDLDIVLLDGRAPFDAGRLLPAGRLREPPSSLNRARVVVLTRVPPEDDAHGAREAVRAAGFTGTIVRAGHRAGGFVTASAEPHPAPGRALAFCGIGDPALFKTDLEGSGVRVEGFRAFRDHHPYAAATWTALCAEALRLGVPLVTTEKDLSRLQGIVGGTTVEPPLLVLRIEASVWDDALLMDAVRRSWQPKSGGVRG